MLVKWHLRKLLRQFTIKPVEYLNTKSFSEVPCNRRQAYNAKSREQSTSGIASNQNKDLVYDILEHRYGSLKSFVRNVSFDDSDVCAVN